LAGEAAGESCTCRWRRLLASFPCWRRRRSSPHLPSQHPLGETLDPVFRVGVGGAKASYSLLGASFLEVEPVRQICGPLRLATMVCSSWSTLHMPGASEEPFGLAHRFGEAHVLLFRACRSSLVLSRLAKRLLVDQVDATVFGEHCERSVARVARPCASRVPPTSVLYVLWCLSVACRCSGFRPVSL
jgi:hypothetical protein